MNIESNLREYRRSAGMTQEQLANAVGVTRQTVHAIELGKYQPSLFVAYKCAKLFHVPIEKLFTFK